MDRLEAIHQREHKDARYFWIPEITRAPCTRRNGGAIPRAERFGDFITVDHKNLSDNCESRNNHRCAIVVQDLTTQMDPVVSVLNKNF